MQKGKLATNGTQFMHSYISDRDCVTVTLLKEAGAIIICRDNVP